MEDYFMFIEDNRIEYEKQREERVKRLTTYANGIQQEVQSQTSDIVKVLVEERHRQGLTQCDMADLTGMMASNIARFESGARVPTFVVLQKYAWALGKHIEIQVCDGTE